MQKWEHLFEQTDTAKEIKKILAKASEEGWELVSVINMPGKRMTGTGPAAFSADMNYWNFFFKRPV